jgi:very-short-patch-repair endonuclease
VERPGLVVHRRALRDDEMKRVEGLPVTSPKRTIEDLAKHTDAATLDRLIGLAHGLRLVDEADLTHLLGHAPQVTRSEAERLLLDLIRRAGLPRPETNQEIGGWSVDVLWRRHRVAVELDSWAWHGRRSRFERDRRKDRAMRQARIDLVRVTARQLTEEPEAVAVDLATTLALAA